MRPTVPLRDRVLAVSLLVAALVALYLLVVHPWLTVPLQALAEEAEALQERQARVQAQVGQHAQVQQQLQQARQMLEGQPLLIDAVSAEQAAAALLQRLEQEVAQASPGSRSCVISNRAPLPADTRAAFTKVVVQVRLRCGTPELATVLHALESGSPALFVENMVLLALAGGAPGATQAGGIDASFDLAGYMTPVATGEGGHDE